MAEETSEKKPETKPETKPEAKPETKGAVEGHLHFDPRRIVIRGYPKTIFFYPTAVVALICAFASKSGAVAPSTLGFVFMTIFAFNLVVTSFEFRRHAPVVMALIALVAILALVLLDQRFGVVGVFGALYRRIHIEANASFYFAVSMSLGLVFSGIYISSRFEFYEVRGNELIHHTGLLGDVERFPVQSLRFKKEITDVFEFLLLASGRIVIYPSRTEHPIVIDCVPGVNSVAESMETVLDSLRVDVEREG